MQTFELSFKRLYCYWMGLFWVLTPTLQADISTDGTVGSAQILTGPNFSIPESLGSRNGTNLFHSFQHFNLASGEQATYTGSSAIKNVISRVTGGQQSTINGVLRSTIGQADFYFLNPAGVVFGSGAQIDVPASFYVSTANELKFADGSVYSASSPMTSTLTFDQPESFGFLGDQTAAINVEGSNLSLKSGRTLSLSASELTIDRSRILINVGELQLTALGNEKASIPISGNRNKPAQGGLSISNSFFDISGAGAGLISIKAGQSEIVGSNLFADNTGALDASPAKGLEIYADSLTINNSFLGTDTFSGGYQAANLTINTTSALTITNGGRVASSSYTASNAGIVTVDAGQLIVSNGSSIFSIAGSRGGNAGTIKANIKGTLSLVDRSAIYSITAGSGDAGNILINAGDLLIDGNRKNAVTGIVSDVQPFALGNAGTVTVNVKDKLSISKNGRIRSHTFGKGNAGSIEVNASQINIEGDGFQSGILSDAKSGSEGNAGSVTVVATENLSISNSGIIRSTTFANGNTGSVDVEANQIKINGNGIETGIFSDTNPGSGGNAGNVTVTGHKDISLIGGGLITSTTFGSGNAGLITVNAGQLTIDEQEMNRLTGILSTAERNSVGKANAGTVIVNVDELLSIIGGGLISTTTFKEGNAGEVTVNAGQLTIDRNGSQFITGVFSNANSGSLGNAGKVTVNVEGVLSLEEGGAISSNTFSTGKAGSVEIDAGQINLKSNGNRISEITSEASPNSQGDAGSVKVNTDGFLSIQKGLISSSTIGGGNAGVVVIEAGQINIDGDKSVISSSSIATNSSGNAGSVKLKVKDTLSIVNGGVISTFTLNKGDAGMIDITADKFIINGQGNKATGIFGLASVDSNGQAGSIAVNANNIFITDGAITISSNPTVDEATLARNILTEINIDAQNITLKDSVITTKNPGNIPAGSINLKVSNILSIDPSTISTEANNANAGDISIQAGIIDLLDSQITTSVTGQGNGGNISLKANALVLESGFIQANTSGNNVQGGNISIDTDALISSQNILLTGGNTPLSFQKGTNVIQAAAPDGVSGTINITSPQLDISGELTDLESVLLDVDELAQNPCSTRGGQQSTLSSLGRGGLPESPEQAGSVVVDLERLNRLLPTQKQLSTKSFELDNPFTQNYTKEKAGMGQMVAMSIECSY